MSHTYSDKPYPSRGAQYYYSQPRFRQPLPRLSRSARRTLRKRPRLQPRSLSLRLTIVVRDKDGKVVQAYDKTCKSWVLNFFKLMQLAESAANVAGVVDTGGVSRTCQNSANTFAGGNAAAGTDANGIQVGTGSTAPATGDTKLQTQIANGAGAGQLNYGAGGTGVATSAAGVSSLSLTRTFTNGSGAAITVNEVGNVCQAQDNGGVARNFLCIRDVLSPAVTIPNGGSATATYKTQGAV